MPTYFHDPPASGYLGPLAKEITARGVGVRMVGRGITASLIFDDAYLADKFGRIYFNQPPTSGPSTFIWQNGDEIGPVSDIVSAAECVVRMVNPECEEELTE